MTVIEDSLLFVKSHWFDVGGCSGVFFFDTAIVIASSWLLCTLVHPNRWRYLFTISQIWTLHWLCCTVSAASLSAPLHCTASVQQLLSICRLRSVHLLSPSVLRSSSITKQDVPCWQTVTKSSVKFHWRPDSDYLTLSGFGGDEDQKTNRKERFAKENSNWEDEW